MHVQIAIQARSTSTRFPGKIFATLGDKSILEHVVWAVRGSMIYINKSSQWSNIEVSCCLLVPENDDAITSKHWGIIVETGPEDDVLTRFRLMSDKFKPDYVCRITADCPLIPSYLITKHINVAVKNKLDYVSNVHEDVRVSFDGIDCEVFSRALLEWADENAKDPVDREHVTTFMRRELPPWAKQGHVIGFLEMADMKLSVDTVEDLDRIRFHYEKTQSAVRKAKEISGDKSVFRF